MTAFSPGEVELRNFALDLAQQWGEDWLKPIQGRLHAAFPSLPPAELDRLNDIAQRAMKAGYDLVYALARPHAADLGYAEWRTVYLTELPWVDDGNLQHLFSTGQYYARK